MKMVMGSFSACFFHSALIHVSEASQAKADVPKADVCEHDVEENVLLQSHASVLKSHGSESSTTKFIAGVPVYNYHLAYEGKVSLSEHGVEEKAEWVVVAKEGTSQQQLDELCAASGSDGCNLEGSETGFGFVEFGGTVKELEDLFVKFPGQCAYAEPDMMLEVSGGADRTVDGDWLDCREETPWGLNVIGERQAPGKGRGVTIYLLDTGVRTSHVEFQHTPQASAIELTGVRTEQQRSDSSRAAGVIDVSTGHLEVCDFDSTCALDLHGHGTHVAGTAIGLNCGVAPEAKLAAVKVLNDKGSGLASWAYSALDKVVGYYATHGRHPSVALLGVGGSSREHSFKDAVDMAVNAGLTVVVAAGNNNNHACDYAPAFIESAITVGAGTESNQKAKFSNYGKCVDIWAPGSNIPSAGHSSDENYFTDDGTSMAAAHVAGAAAIALGLALDNQWAAKPGDVRQILEQLATVNKGEKLLYIGGSWSRAPAAAPALAPGTR